MNPCAACGAENEPGRKFCGECGSSLARACPSCGSPNPPSVKFCGECGAALTATAPAAQQAGAPAPAAERRLVTVLFADLVGFTSLSEARDAEEVRELLSRYFDTSRTLIERYGGTVEKFIGDAVMAVWGAPVATEHDAERAVRAALDLVSAVAAMGEEVGATDLRLRAGVLTGEAAVNLGATSQGMVAGDMVNTASRIQSAARPGTVLVGEATKRATEATVVFEDAGTFDLKGKTEAVPLWRARRVVAGAQGSLKSAGLEPPFVGRDRELRTVKDLLHASADESRAHLVSVTGIAGIGKSRLSWEFYKYFDGLEQLVLYHRGRCLSYGEGVAYWALVEMVKMRARIAEDEDGASAAAKLRTVVEEYLPDEEERRWVEPRLLHLLGLEERAAADRDDLFAAWRLFFERMAEQEPVVIDLRGSAVGRRGAPGLHRVPLGVVAEPRDPGDRPCPGPSWPTSGRGGPGRAGGSHPCTSSRCRTRRCGSCSMVWCRASRSRSPRASWRAPRACRCTRSRPCGCCWTAGCSAWKGRCTSRRDRSRTSRCPRPCTR